MGFSINKILFTGVAVLLFFSQLYGFAVKCQKLKNTQGKILVSQPTANDHSQDPVVFSMGCSGFNSATIQYFKKTDLMWTSPGSFIFPLDENDNKEDFSPVIYSPPRLA